ncbi:MAG TPA: MMPL family transporter [Verrucomicrobiae bacterium]|nr:MMPL family transporter [Verrucomicrobiae bacterium]
MKSLSETFFGRMLGRLADAVARHRWLFLWPQFVLFALCVVYTCLNLKFDPNRDDLVGSDKKYHQNFLNFKKEFPAQDDLVVVVESEDAGKNRQFVERLGAKLELETNLFTDVLYKHDFNMLGKKALLFVPETNLVDLRTTLVNYLPFIQRFTQATNLESLFAMVNSQFLHAKREANKENDSLVKAVPMLDRIVREAAASLQRPGTPPSPGLTALFGAGDDDVYITYAKGRIYLVTAQAKREDLNDEAVDRMRKLVNETSREVPGLNLGVTGESVLEHDEMNQSQKDSTLASIVSLVLCALIFIYGYQETGRPLKATLCLLIGLGYTLAFTTLVVGHLNLLTITFMPILIGLAIDFGVHLITRYEEELRLGRSEEVAMRKAIVFTGQGVFTGALTTAAAFLAMWLTDFKGIQEMGIICGGGMLICLIPMLTLLPVLLFRGRQNVIDHEKAAKPSVRARLEGLWLQRPVVVAVVTLALTVLSLTQFHRVFFDYDLLNMQSKGLPAVVFEKKLIDSTPKSVIFGDIIADSPQQAVELEERLKKLPAVSEVESMAPRLIGDQSKKLKLIGEIKREIAPIHFLPADTTPVGVEQLSSTLYSTYGYMGAAADDVDSNSPPSFSDGDIIDLEAFATRLKAPAPSDHISKYINTQLSGETRNMLERYTNGADSQLEQALVADLNRVIQTVPSLEHPPEMPDPPGQSSQPQDAASQNQALLVDAYPQELTTLPKQLRSLRTSINELRKQMLKGDQTVAADKLGAFQQALFNDVHDTFQALQEQDNRERLRIEDLPPPLRNRFIGKTGKYLLQVYPKEDIWQRDKQEEFVKELRTVDPNATGTPVQLYEYTTLLRDSYQQAAWYALGAIIIMVLVHFRTISSVILSLLPVGVGSIWLGGLMGFFDIPFNPANIMTLPLVIGIGVTNGIHILNRFAEEKNPGILAKSTGKAVFISGLTTMSGFGSLIIAKHQGIQSLGAVMTMGVATCMIAGLTFLPAMLNLLSPWRVPIKQPSGDNARSTLGREEPR